MTELHRRLLQNLPDRHPPKAGDFNTEARAVRAWVAGVIAPGLVIRPWRHLGLVLGGALVLPVRNLRFTLDGQGEVYRTPVAAGRGFAGVEVFLP